MSGIRPQKYIWLDGELINWDEAKIHIVSHVIHYGTGVFEGIRAYETTKGPAIFRLRDHLRRFFNSAKVYRININYSMEELIEACKKVVRENNLGDSYIRPIAFKHGLIMGLDSRECKVSVAIIAWPWGRYLGEAYYKGCRCKTSSWRRLPPYSVPIAAKACGHYLNNQLAKIEALENGYDEAIMLDHRGFVSEGSGENIFVVKDGKLHTPPLFASILPGITRDTVIVLAKDAGYEIYERDLTLTDLYHADEVFFTGTAAEITPVVEVDGIKIGMGKPGPITKWIQKTYENVVRGVIEKYRSWLTFV